MSEARVRARTQIRQRIGTQTNLAKIEDTDWRELLWRAGDIQIRLRSNFVEVSWIQPVDDQEGVTMTVMDEGFDSVEFVLKANNARPDVMFRFKAIRLLWDSWTHMKRPEEQTLF